METTLIMGLIGLLQSGLIALSLFILQGLDRRLRRLEDFLLEKSWDGNNRRGTEHA